MDNETGIDLDLLARAQTPEEIAIAFTKGMTKDEIRKKKRRTTENSYPLTYSPTNCSAI